MIIFSDGMQSGINPLYPALLPGRNSLLLGRDFSTYFQWVPLYLVGHSVVITLLSLAAYVGDARIGGFLFFLGALAQMAVIFVKIAKQRGPKLEFHIPMKRLDSRPAPILAWVEQFAVAANFVLIGRLGLFIATYEPMRFLAFCLILFYLPYSFLPIVNYFVWWKNRR